MSPNLRQEGPPPLPERFDAVQGLRAWAMLLVFSFHWNRFLDARWPNAVSAAFLSIGGWGTNLFLCVAGCFLHRSLARRPTRYLDFLQKRFRRLYPVYAFILTLVLGIDTLSGAGRTGLSGHWSDFALLASNYLLLPALLQDRLILDVSWTLAYIAGFTLLAPALTAALRPLPQSWRIAASASLWLLSLCASLSWHLFSPRVTLLAAGICVWESLHDRHRWLLVLSLSGLALAAGAHPNVAVVPSLLLAVLAGPHSLRTLLSCRLLQCLGDRSYSFYLCHGFPLLAAARYLFPRLDLWQAMALSPLVLAAALAFSETVYRAIELPFRARRVPAIPQPRLSVLPSIQPREASS